jgi:hypothetical protein
MGVNRKVASGFLLTALLVLGGLTAVLFVAPNLVIIGYFFLIVPGIILTFTPSVFLYLLLFGIGWFGLRGKPPLVAAGTGLALVIAVGWLLPEVLNEAAREELAGAFRREVVEPHAPRSWRTVALQTVGPTAQGECNDVCRLLLFNGEVERVLVLNAPDAPAAGRRTSPPPTPALFRIERSGSCAADKNKYRSRFGDQWLERRKMDEIDRAVRLRAATGECLMMEPAGGTVADLTVRLLRQREPAGGLRLLPATVNANGIELNVGGRVVLRRVNLKASLYNRPLHLEPIQNGLEMSGWKWGRREFVSGKEVDVEQALREGAGFQLDPLSGVSPKQLRAELNAALDRRELPADDAVFLLVEDFLKELRENISPEEAALVARVIRDSRFTAFGLLGDSILQHHNVAGPALDAMLDRLQELSREKGFRRYRQLEERIDALPPGALRAPDPRGEALLADEEVRAASPHLVVRLAERGPSAAPVLVGYMKSRWTPQQLRRDGYDRDAQAALAGLCRIGVDARDYLPELRRWEQSGQLPAHLPASANWRATLIALGAIPDEFTPPGREHPIDYRRLLVDLSRRCPLRRGIPAGSIQILATHCAAVDHQRAPRSPYTRLL